MKHVFSVLSVACVAFFTLFLSTTNVSCKKGDTGPKGDTGVANAIYSPWIDVQFTDGALVRPGDTVAVATIPAPQITKDVLDKGLVKVYANFGTAADPNIVAIPYLEPTGYFWVNANFEVGNINLSSSWDADFSAPYRYIIITGTVPTNGRQNVNWNDYNEVKKLYNIKD
ncbi:hypothetical protein A4H97_27000 [Niastella yeongjuensis]|uniref:Uncharacterized protein n=1 Tax=Niastella yeongjuensis TaxID=354355 RepID=A0A1V9F0B7_9BACT|nr:hypothetical protein [Niastella yeongjuensis]OQP51853.1 hypothetical protein A4H97_27000 [Niastella yeongjuensis]SEP44241.1 hypothetical protein SAMN05660816_06174 [Niastella yeongjuensis]